VPREATGRTTWDKELANIPFGRERDGKKRRNGVSKAANLEFTGNYKRGDKLNRGEGSRGGGEKVRNPKKKKRAVPGRKKREKEELRGKTLIERGRAVFERNRS